jgi:hypothetical protein
MSLSVIVLVERFFIATASVLLLNLFYGGAIPLEGRSYNNYLEGARFS